ncbi:CD63 antigen [Monomorium pharaonis]|uniref:CD63 antigen n=1 Tax=Monomorium pharaonis TaxID=307658 RepID=UPI00063EE655|nr:CD63 antigen [Monomorium pharaonis]
MGLLNSFSVNRRTFEKFYFYTFNVYIAVCGLSTVAWSRAATFQIESVNRITAWKDDATISLEVLMIVGTSLFLIAFFGGGFSLLYFDNAKFRNWWSYTFCTTATFAVLFLVVIIAQATAAIYMLVKVPTAKDDFIEAFKNYYQREGDKHFIDDTQAGLFCCGINSYRDYAEILRSPIPGSCCDSWRIDSCTEDDVKYRRGCVHLLSVYGYTLAFSIYAISTFTLIVTVVEFVGFIIALYLVYSIRKRNAMETQTKKYQQPHVTPR